MPCTLVAAAGAGAFFAGAFFFKGAFGFVLLLVPPELELAAADGALVFFLLDATDLLRSDASGVSTMGRTTNCACTLKVSAQTDLPILFQLLIHPF